MFVYNTIEGTQGGKKRQRGTATATIRDDLERAVGGATVLVNFGGDFFESAGATTNASGIATLTTAGSLKGTVIVDFCVNTIVATPLYQSIFNAVPSYECSVSKSDELARSESPPRSFSLAQNYPNPFNPSTVISYAVPESGLVTLKIYDMLGREVKTLVNGHKEAAIHNVVFDAGSLPVGSYMYMIRSGNYSATKRMTLLK